MTRRSISMQGITRSVEPSEPNIALQGLTRFHHFCWWWVQVCLSLFPHPLGVPEVLQEWIWKRIHQEAYSRILHLLHIASCQCHQDHWSCPGQEQGVVWGGAIGGDQERGHVTEWSRVLFQVNIDGSVIFARSSWGWSVVAYGADHLVTATFVQSL